MAQEAGGHGRGSSLSHAVNELLIATTVARADLAATLGMSVKDVELLQLVSGTQEHLGPSELARRLSVSSAATTQSSARLVASGHLVRQSHPHDRRRQALRATEEGMEHVMVELGPLLLMADGAAEGMTTSEQEVVERYLGRLVDAYRSWLSRAHTSREEGAAGAPGEGDRPRGPSPSGPNAG